MSYEVGDFGLMALDEVRTKTWLAAIRAHVSPGMRVLDLGCGTGFFTLEAARLGAIVTAIDMVDAVDLLPEVVKANGYEDRVEVWQGDVRAAEFDPFDVVIADIRGITPLFNDVLDVWAHVQQKLVKPGGRLLAQTDDLRAALVSMPEWHERRLAPFRLDDHDWTAVERIALASPAHLTRTKTDQVCSTEITWAQIDYNDPESLSSRHFNGSEDVDVLTDCQTHGILLWADITIAPGITYSTGHLNPAIVYGQMLLPFAEPIGVHAGQRVTLEVNALRIKDAWEWEWSASSGGETAGHSTMDRVPIPTGSIEEFFAQAANKRNSDHAVRLL